MPVEKNLINNHGLLSNSEATYLTTFQEFLLKHYDFLEFFWYFCWIATLLFLIIRFILYPLIFNK